MCRPALNALKENYGTSDTLQNWIPQGTTLPCLPEHGTDQSERSELDVAQGKARNACSPAADSELCSPQVLTPRCLSARQFWL